MTRTTSRLAYKEIKEDGTAVSQSDYIYSLLNEIPVKDKKFGLTLKEIARVSGFEINAVSGRVNELKKNGKIKEIVQKVAIVAATLHTIVLTIVLFLVATIIIIF